MRWLGSLALVVVCAISLVAQSTPPLLTTGTSLPATCVQGASFILVGSGAGFYICTAPDTWLPLATNVGPSGGSAWGAITGTLTAQLDLQTALDTKAATAHIHGQADVTNLVTALAGKAPTDHTHAEGDVTGLVTDLAGKAASVHTHVQSDITGLVAALAGKAASSHTHAISDTTNLQSTLDGKAASSHTHAPADVTGTAVITSDARLSDARTPLSHNQAGETITTGTVAAARLGSGSPSSANFLRGDGSWQVPSGGGATTLTSTTLQSDAVIANYTAITGLAFTPLANTNYLIDCFIVYTSTAATTGINFAWDVPAAATSIHMSGYTTTTATGANEGFHQRTDNVGTSTSAAVITVENTAVLSARLRNGANATSTTLGFTPETANSVSVLAGSVCQVRSY